MTFGYEFRSGPEDPIVHVDWSKIVQIEGKLATAKLPERFVPTGIGDHPKLFGFDFCYINLASINVPLTSDQLGIKWDEIEKHGMPLNLMSQCLVSFDILRLLAWGHVSATPAWTSLPEIVFLASSINDSGRASGFDVRLRDWAKRLKAEAQQVEHRLAQSQPNEFVGRIGQLGVSLASCMAEFRVMEQVIQNGKEIKLQPSGAEFVISGHQPVRAEVKARLGHLPSDLWRVEAQGEPTLQSLINPPGYLLALSLLLIDKFKQGFDEQGCDLLFEDISHTYLGWLLPACAAFWGKPLPFDDALTDALKAVSQGDRAAIAYSYTAGPSGHINALSLTKSQVDELARIGRDVLRLLKDKPDAKLLTDLLSRLAETRTPVQ